MTHTEIKNFWSLFKKAIVKEIDFDLTGCCYMNKKQLENGTATITLNNDIPFEIEINRLQASIERINGLDTWTAEEKQRNEKYNLEHIANYEARKAAHGTKINETQNHAEQILSSAAFQKLAKAIGIQDTAIEYTKGIYQLRIVF